jgi:hypothetical protein
MKKTEYDYEVECQNIDDSLKYPLITVACHHKDCNETMTKYWDGSFIDRWYCKNCKQTKNGKERI